MARPGVCTSASYRGVTGSEGQEEANGGGDGAGTEVEVNEGAQDGAGTGVGVGTRRRTPYGTGTGTGTEARTVAEMGKGTRITETRIGSGRVERGKKAQDSCRRRAGNGGDTGGKRKKYRKERIGSVTANPDNLESNKEAGGGAQGTQGSIRICTSRENVSPLSRLIRGFRNKYH